MTTLLPFPVPAKPVLRILFVATDATGTAGYRAWARRMGIQVDARIVGVDEAAPDLIVPTVLLAAGSATARAAALCRDLATAPDRFVVLDVSGTEPAGCGRIDTAVTVLATGITAERVVAWRRVTSKRTAIRLFPVDEATLLSADSPVVPVLQTMFRVGERWLPREPVTTGPALPR